MNKTGIAVRRIERAPADAVKALSRFGVATIHEAMGRAGLLAPYMRPIYPGARVCGTAVTALGHPGDNWMLHVAAEMLQPGDVVVLALSSPDDHGFFGELLATSFRARGGLGLVIDAGVRDIAELQAMNFPVWSKAVHAKGTIKATVGSVNMPVDLRRRAGESRRRDRGRRRWRGGGAAAKAAEIAQAAQAREDKEAATRKRLAAGELGLDIYDMRGKLEEAGLVYYDTPGDVK